MNSIAQAKTGTYDNRKAIATRKRRQERGQYVTAAQKSAFAHLMQRDGRKSLTQAECEALASHPHLSQVQKVEFEMMLKFWGAA